MIFDKIENISKYKGIHKGLDLAIEFILSETISDKEVGRYEIEGDSVFYLIQEYMTKTIEEAKMETHERYMDVQWVLEGEEIMGYSPKSDLIPTTDYSPEKDIQFFDGGYAPLHLKAGMFAIFFPHEGHKPCITVNQTIQAKKAVFKIAY